MIRGILAQIGPQESCVVSVQDPLTDESDPMEAATGPLVYKRANTAVIHGILEQAMPQGNCILTVQDRLTDENDPVEAATCPLAGKNITRDSLKARGQG